MNKAKSILKRSLAILLAVLTLMSVGLTSVIALSIDMAETRAYVQLAETGATITSDGTARLYFDIMTSYNWWIAGTGGDKNFAYFYQSTNTSTFKWSAHSVNYEGNIYYVNIPEGSWDRVILTRNNTTTDPSWDNKWNQTYNIPLKSTSNYISKFEEGANSDKEATWGSAIKIDSTASVTPSKSDNVAPNEEITLTSQLTSNTDINTLSSVTYTVNGTGASINNDVFTATQAGEYTVTATVTYYPNGYSGLTSTKTATTTIKVVDPNYDYSAVASPTNGGTVEPATGSVKKGETIELTATANEGYEFVEWTSSNGTFSNTTSSETSSTTTFKPTANNATATAKFELKEYTVTFNDYDNSNLNNVTTKHGSKPQITDPVRTGYTFDGWKAESTGEVYATADLPVATGAETYTAQYSINKYTFKTYGFDTDKATMTITIGDEVIDATADFEKELDYNTTIHVEIVPNAPYTLTVGDEVVEGDLYDKYITIGASNKTLAISFSDRTFDVAINQTGSDEEGTVSIGEKVYTSENNTHKIVYGTRTISITAPEHYYILSVTGNGNYYTDDGSKKESTTVDVNVTANDDITITYAEMDKYTLTINQSGVDITKEYHTYSHVIKIDGDVDSAITESPLVSHEFELYGGKHTLYIGAPHNHYIKSVKINNEDVTANAYNGTKYWIVDNYEFNLSADITIDVEYDYNPIISIEHKYSDGTPAGVVTTFTDGTSIGDNQVLTNFNDSTDSISYTINALEGDYIVSITENDEVIYTDNGRFKTTFTPETAYSSLTEDKNIVVTYDKIPTYSLEIGEHSGGTIEDGDGTTIEVGTTTGIYGGTEFTYTAKANTGYYFTGWKVEGATVADLSSKTISFTLNDNTTVTPGFQAAKGTITFVAGDGGEVTQAGDNEITYPTIITSKATATTAGYIFTGWTITGGEAGVDYEIYSGSTTTESITLRILEDGAKITAKANFQNATKVQMYIYTDAGYTLLDLDASNGTASVPLYDDAMNSIMFGNNTWYTPGELTFTAGYNASVTAQLSSENPFEGDGNLLVFNDTNEWGSVYAYLSGSQMKYSSTNSNDYGVSSSNITGIKMNNVPGTDYYYLYTTEEISYVAFAKIAQNNYNWFHNNFVSYPASNGGGTVTGSYSSNTPMFTPSDVEAWTNSSYNRNGTTYYNSGKWEALPNVNTESGEIDIKEAFYDKDGNWIVENGEVWIYIDSEKNVSSSNRRGLADTLSSGDVIEKYNNGVNDAGWKSQLWTNFVNAYNAAVVGLGNPETDTTTANNLASDLLYHMGELSLTDEITLIGTPGAYKDNTHYFGDIKFYTKNTEGKLIDVEVTEGNDGKVDDRGGIKYYRTDLFNRYDTVIIQSTLSDDYKDDYIVYGWVINGTDWVLATEDKTTGVFEGNYYCDKNVTIIPVYFRRDVFDETNKNIVQVFADIGTETSEWGNYISAYTWVDEGSDYDYRQFGAWGGQVMIPDTSRPGTYYTFVEKADPDHPTEPILGITFNNYGGDVFNDRHFYQTYDYYEFIELSNQNKDIITFELKEKTTSSNWPATTEFKINGIYEWEGLVNYSDKLVDINGTELTDQKSTDVGLYVVRTGPCNPGETNDHGVGEGYADLGSSEFYVNAYVYDSDGIFLVNCKTYELKNLAKLLEKRIVDLSVETYQDKLVMVDYASVEDDRFDGEWFGVRSDEITVDIEVQVALKNGTVTYQYDQNPEVPNINDTYGSGYINSKQKDTVQMGSSENKLTASNVGNFAFVGWYLASDDDKDGRYTIDVTRKPLQNGERTVDVKASGDAVYIAVFEELTAGSFTVINDYYSHSFFDTSISSYAPTPQSEDPVLSDRYVDVVKIYDASDDSSVSGGSTRGLTKNSLTLQDITEGDKLRITIQTVPTRTNDFVYAWYIQANDEFGINFEEVGLTDEIFDYDTDKGQGKEFTFEYTVKKDERSLTIYSDIFHYSSDVNLVYVYNNRYNQQRKYIVKYELNDDEIADNHTPSPETIEENAPYVEDYYKDVSWEAATVSEAGTVWTIYAVEDKTYEVNIAINGTPYDPIYGEFNDAMDIYASELDTTLSTVKGIWYEEVGTPNGKYDAGTDKVIGYGNYLGLAITRDMNLVYTTDAELIYQIILDAPVYGREQDNSGETTIDTIYADYLISYMLPHFHGDTINVNGNDVLLEQDTDRHTPVQVQTLRDAGLTVEYGIVTELINTDGELNPDGSKNAEYESYFGRDDHIQKDSETGELTLEELKIVLNNEELDYNVDGKPTRSGYAEGVGVSDADGKPMTYFYAYNAENISNKNRVLKTFKFGNPQAYETYYYNVYGYLVISDGTENGTHYYISNVQTLSMSQALAQTYPESTNS